MVRGFADVVGSVVWHKEAEIRITENSSDADETSSSSWNDAHVLPCVLRRFALTMMRVVEISYRFAERLDPCCWAILAASH